MAPQEVAMAAHGPEPGVRDVPLEAGTEDLTTSSDEDPTINFLPLTAETEPSAATSNTQDDNRPVGGPPNAVAGTDTPSLAVATQTTLTQSALKLKSLDATTGSASVVQDGPERASTSSSIWSTAATTLKNLVIGKPQPQPIPSGIVMVVPDPATTQDIERGLTSQAPGTKLDKGRGKAVPPDEQVLPLNETSASGSLPPILPLAQQKPNIQRPSAPPPRLSTIAHSLPTTSAHPPHPAPSSQQSTNSPSSIQSPHSTTSQQTDTSATTATDEENQAAALAALNAVIQSVGTGYTQPLTSRAAQLHANDLLLAQQREKLMKTTGLLAKDTAALQKLTQESNNKLKAFGDLEHWSKTLDNDLKAIEETLRIVDRGTLEVCAKCEEGIAEDEHQRWCGVCGKGFHEGCAPPDPVESEQELRRLDGKLGERVEEQGEDGEGGGEGNDERLHERMLSESQQASSHLEPPVSAMAAAVVSTSPRDPPPQHLSFQPAASTQPSVPKPSSMFEWGGIPDAIRDIAALRVGDGEGSESGSEGSGSGSEWSGEDWRCAECRLKDDLDGIVMGL